MTRRRARYDTEAEAAAPSVVDEVRIDSAQACRLSVAFGLLTVLGVGWWVATTDVDWWVVPVRAGLIGALSGFAAYIVLFGLFVRDERQDRKQARQPQQKRLEADATSARSMPPAFVPIVIKREGQRVREQYGNLPIPREGPEALARYFWRVLREGRALALRNPYKIGRDEVTTLKAFFTDNELGEDLGGNLGVKPNDDGNEMMRQFVRRHYPDAHLP